MEGRAQGCSLPLGVALLPLDGWGKADPEFLREDSEHCHQGHQDVLSETAVELSNTGGLASCSGTYVLSTCHAWLFHKQVHSINRLTEGNSLTGKSEPDPLPRLHGGVKTSWPVRMLCASCECSMASVNALWLVSTL